MAHERRYQKGTLFKRGKRRKVWVARFRDYAVDASGKPRCIQRSEILGFVEELPRRWQAEEVLGERLRLVNSPSALLSMRSLAQFVEKDWQRVIFPTMKYATQRSYEYVLGSHVLPVLGGLPLREISRERIQRLLNEKMEAGYAWETVRHIRYYLSKVLGTAEEWEFLDENPVRKTKLPRRSRRKAKTVLTPEQFQRLLIILPEPSRSLVQLLTSTGVRIGELLALRWRHVDLERQVLQIEEAVYEGHFDDPKTEPSVRPVPLGPRAADLLATRGPGRPSELVFSTRKGKPLDRRTLLHRQLKPACRKLGIAGVSWHSLRHANATLHDTARTPLGTLQALLGHAPGETTREVYLHAYWSECRNAAEKVEEMLFVPKLFPTGAEPEKSFRTDPLSP